MTIVLDASGAVSTSSSSLTEPVPRETARSAGPKTSSRAEGNQEPGTETARYVTRLAAIVKTKSHAVRDQCDAVCALGVGSSGTVGVSPGGTASVVVPAVGITSAIDSRGSIGPDSRSRGVPAVTSVGIASSVRIATGEDVPDGQHENAEVEPERPVFDVVEIE